MALTRSALREKGVTEKEVLDFIMEQHGDTVEAAKEKAKETAETAAQRVIDALQAKVDSLPADSGDGTDWKAKHDTIKGEFDTYKANVENGRATSAKRTALRAALKAEGANEKLIELLESKFDLAAIELDGEKVKGFAELVKPVKEQFAEVFGKVETVGIGAATPPANTGGVAGKTLTELMAEANANPGKLDDIMAHVSAVQQTDKK